jgi:hypothetical protein
VKQVAQILAPKSNYRLFGWELAKSFFYVCNIFIICVRNKLKVASFQKKHATKECVYARKECVCNKSHRSEQITDKKHHSCQYISKACTITRNHLEHEHNICSRRLEQSQNISNQIEVLAYRKSAVSKIHIWLTFVFA